MTPIMYWNIFGHSVFQLVILCILLFAGPEICDGLGYPIANGIGLPHTAEPTIHFTLIFNTLVIMTLFNEINCRKLFHERNVFEHLQSNMLFFYVEFMQIGCQIILIQIPAIGSYTKTVPLPLWAWIMCFVLGFMSLPVQQIIITVANFVRARSGSKFKVTPVEDGDKKSYASKVAPVEK
jgi:Ca2+ transporting ATPase